MSLSTIQQKLLPELSKLGWGNHIFKSIQQSKYVTVKGAVGSSTSLFVAQFFLQKKENILYILDDKEAALYANSELENLLGIENVLYFPATYRDPYQAEKTQNANIVLRTEVIQKINTEGKPKVIVAYAGALSEKIIRRENFAQLSHEIKVGDKLSFDFIEEILKKLEFHRTDFVSEPGEFSIRGGIMDIFSFSNEKPYRINFFGDEIETIKIFDIETQLSVENTEKFSLISNINNDSVEEKISFLEYIPKETFLVLKNGFLIAEKHKNFYKKALEGYEKLSKDIKHQKPKELFVSEEVFQKQMEHFSVIDFSSFPSKLSETEINLHQTEQPIFHKNFPMLIEDLENKLKENYSVFISFSSEKQKERLEAIFQELEKNTPFKSFASELHEGFVDDQNKISVYTDHQIFDRYQRYKSKNSFAKSEQLTLKDLMSLKVGDYITHIDHGIGKFMGLVKINNNGKNQECFKLNYKNGDLLYVSIHALHKISKYNGPDGKEVVLSKLGSPAWKSLKQKTKAKVKQIAFDLIKLYTQRKTIKGFLFSPDGYLQTELEASFLYEDTPDQEKATVDVKKDMESETIMDRLICGDVGFGKTEVAIRAAFKAATDGKQVAILVPTTILAFQHYRSFKERLKDFPVEVSYLNRFRTAKQKKETLEGLANGKIDIVIGTHQLVGSSVKFKDLGLLIIDEEHKFGVAVKDKLKNLKTNIDTLTLTATPIPRTLQFSLMSARDLSVIKTPPPNRQPIDTQVVRFNEEIIRDAISYELERNGQVYFINNRVENLKEVAGLIQRLVPDARVITGHGRMNGTELENNIVDFMEGKYDVLVSTTIVESGVDVPNANTVFINDAHRFGMADLHQIRGRVGRGNRKAFCYLITPDYGLISSDSRKRLEAIEQFSDLGSGFQIAMKDLEIRGAGDLLGGEQSGFINEMGFETYQKILQEALEELKEEEFENIVENEEDRQKLFKSTKEVNIDTDLELLLPNEYVSNTEERLILYQKLSEINNDEELSQFRKEIEDRFGKLPEQAEDLLRSISLKWIALEIGFEKIVIKNDVFLGYLPRNPQDKFYNTERFKKIISYLSANPNQAQLKEKQNSLILRKDGVGNIEEVQHLLKQIIEIK